MFFTFRSLIHLELIFMDGVKRFRMKSQLSQHFLLNRLFSLTEMLRHPHHKSNPHIHLAPFLGTLFYWSLCPARHQYHIVLITLTFKESLGVSFGGRSTFFLRMAQHFVGPLLLCMRLRISWRLLLRCYWACIESAAGCGENAWQWESSSLNQSLHDISPFSSFEAIVQCFIHKYLAS